MESHKVFHVGSIHDYWAIEPNRMKSYLQTFAIAPAEDVDFEERSCPRKIEHYSLDGEPMEMIAANNPKSQQQSIAVMPLVGPITYRGSAFSAFFGGTSVVKWRAAFNDLVNAPGVAGILIDTDSPGGSVSGIAELSKTIRDARTKKPIAAVANTWAASAAYHLIAQTGHISVSPSGEIGSIGVYSIHMDYSAALEQMGVKATIISAGEFKTEFTPYEPLSEEAAAEEQAKVDHYYSIFVDAVAKGRNTTPTKVKKSFGQGRMVVPEKAVERGMADSVGTFEQALRRLGGEIQDLRRVAEESQRRKEEIEMLERRYGRL